MQKYEFDFKPGTMHKNDQDRFQMIM